MFKKMKKVLVLDDHYLVHLGRIYDWFLEKIYGDVEINYVSTVEQFSTIDHSEYDLIILDWDLGSVTLDNIFDEIESKKLIIITDYANEEHVKNFAKVRDVPLLMKPKQLDPYLTQLKMVLV